MRHPLLLLALPMVFPAYCARAPVLEGSTGSTRAGALELRVVSALRAESGGATRVLTTPLAPLTASLLRPAAVAPGRYHLAAVVTLGVGRPPTGPAVAAAPEQRVRVPVGTLRVGY
jgi:hypothetical protein